MPVSHLICIETSSSIYIPLNQSEAQIKTKIILNYENKKSSHTLDFLEMLELRPANQLNTLQFADDQVVLAGDKEDLEYMTRKLKETYENWGLDMSLNKTKYLCIGRTENSLKLDEDNEIEFCQEYKYLGVIFDTSGTDDK